jgi:hypothetical protein
VAEKERESRNLFSSFIVKKKQTNIAIKMKNSIEIDVKENADHRFT